MDKQEYLQKIAEAAFQDEFEKISAKAGKGLLKTIGESYQSLGSAGRRIFSKQNPASSEGMDHVMRNFRQGQGVTTAGETKLHLVGKDLKKGALAGGVTVVGAGGLTAGGVALSNHLNKKKKNSR